MNFWDSSALVPMVVNQEQSGHVRRLYEDLSGEGERAALWVLTPVECCSALCRLLRMREMTEDEYVSARKAFTDLMLPFEVVMQIDTVIRHSERLLRSYPLSAADALQLAAALAACSDNPSSHCFVTLDRVLAEAASKEGFKIFPL